MMIDMNIVQQARNADLIDFLQKHCGYTFTKQRGSYRCKQHPSLAVKNDRLSFYWHSKAIGGYGPLDFLIKVEQASFRQAVETVTGINPVTLQPRQETEAPITLFLPEKAGIPIRLYDYLCVRRGISRNIVDALIREGKLYEDKRGNVIFVAYDEHNKPRFASVRGTYDRVYRMDCVGSDKRYGFNMTYSQSKRLYLYESAIDAMSAATLLCIDKCDMGAWKHDNRLSLAGTSDTALPKYLELHPFVEELSFNLDNDAPGREATVTLMEKYTEQGYITRMGQPLRKDYSDDLQAMVREIQAEKTRIRAEISR